jgi:hypothetical protein
MTNTPHPEWSPEFLNETLILWDNAGSMEKDKVLAAHMAAHSYQDHVTAMNEILYSVTGAGYSFLMKFPESPKNSEELWAAHDAAIIEENPWLNEDNLARAKGQSRYYAWHDGLVKS